MDHMEMPQLSAHRVYLQQSTKEKVEVLYRRHHMCLWKSRINYRTHVTVLPTRITLALWMTLLCNILNNGVGTDTIHEPCVPHTRPALTTTTPHPSPHQHFRHHHPANTHTTQKQSKQPPHPHKVP